MHRSMFVTGLLLLGGIFGLLGARPAVAGSTTIEITDVFNSVSAGDEWFQLYNETNEAKTLDGFQICTSSTCLTLPSTRIEPFALQKFTASKLTGWPAAGLDGASDMLGLLDASGKAVDSVNWGAVSKLWKNYSLFGAMLFDPGVNAPDPTANESFFRIQISNDTDKASDWMATSTPATGGTPVTTPSSGTTPKPTTTIAPAPTTTPTGNGTGGKIPQTGGEFPLLITVALILAVIALRYFRMHRGPSRP